MQIQNPEVAQIIRDQAKLTIAEGFPQNLLSNVQPVIDMTPRFHRNIKFLTSGLNTASSSSNSFTTTDDKSETYLMGIQVSILKDAACDVANGSFTLSVVKDGDASATNIVRIPYLTLTAQSEERTMMFTRPLKLKKNSSINFGQGTFTAGNFARCGTIFYYEVQ